MRKVGDLIFSLISSDKKVAALLWLITFLLYIPAAKAGWVIDAAGWLCHVRDHSETFWPYLNRSWSTIPGLYQLTQLVTRIVQQLSAALLLPSKRSRQAQRSQYKQHCS